MLSARNALPPIPQCWGRPLHSPASSLPCHLSQYTNQSLLPLSHLPALTAEIGFCGPPSFSRTPGRIHPVPWLWTWRGHGCGSRLCFSNEWVITWTSVLYKQPIPRVNTLYPSLVSPISQELSLWNEHSIAPTSGCRGWRKIGYVRHPAHCQVHSRPSGATWALLSSPIMRNNYEKLGLRTMSYFIYFSTPPFPPCPRTRPLITELSEEVEALSHRTVPRALNSMSPTHTIACYPDYRDWSHR